MTDRFNLSLGVRWDHNRGDTLRGTVLNNNAVAPRLGLVWILNQKSQTVIKAHYGHYYDAPLTRYYWFLTDTFEPIIPEQFIDGHWVEQAIDYGLSDVSQGNLKQPFLRQLSVGIDRVLPGNIPFGAHYIYRRWSNLLNDVGQSEYEPVPFVNPITGETITVYNLVREVLGKVLINPPGLYRRYDGFEIFGNKQFTNKLSLSGSLVFSKLSGNSGSSRGGERAVRGFPG